MRMPFAAIVAAAYLSLAGTASRAANPDSYPPLPEAIESLVSTETVDVRPAAYAWIFQPAASRPTKGLVLYPGGLVDYRAYAPMARDIAARGYLVALMEMPLDIAFLGIDRAGPVIDAFSYVRTWAVGGHSLGGVAACSFAKGQAGRVRGVVLWASYPSSTDSLRRSGLRVLSIYGTLDGLTDASDIEKSRRLLPRSTLYVPIAGGNHTQFGYYGYSEDFVQPDDFPAGITRAGQRDAIVDATADFLDGL
jgi:dienelactone hydrolase